MTGKKEKELFQNVINVKVYVTDVKVYVTNVKVYVTNVKVMSPMLKFIIVLSIKINPLVGLDNIKPSLPDGKLTRHWLVGNSDSILVLVKEIR